MLTLQTYIPTSLTRFVKSFWYIQISEDYTENILPDGHHEIIFHLSPDNARRGAVTEPVAFFAGQTLSSYSLELKKGALLYGIRFYPHTLNSLFHFPAHIITNHLLPLQDIKTAHILQHCISENPSQTFKNLETTLFNICKDADENTYIFYAVNEILKQKGNIRIDDLLKATGISQKHFDTLFHQSVGITPKAFSNIIRLNYFINYRHNHPEKSLTTCCYEASFFDQSHLIKLFQKVTHQSPKAYFKATNQINYQFSEL